MFNKSTNFHFNEKFMLLELLFYEAYTSDIEKYEAYKNCEEYISFKNTLYKRNN